MSLSEIGLRRFAPAPSAWIPTLALAGGVGVACALSPAAGLAAVALGVFVVLLLLPPVVVIVATPVVSVLYRLASPTASGVLGLAPDFLIAAVLVHAAMRWVAGTRGGSDPEVRRALWLALAALIVVAASSALSNGDSVAATLVSLRQFGRFPLWCVGVLYLGLDLRQSRWLVLGVLGAAFAQVPLSFWQFTGHASAAPAAYHLQRFDLVSGSLGIGGSGVLTVLLILAFVLWSSLALLRVVRAWAWLLGSAGLILPMAWGSAASFVLLVPLSLAALLVRFVLTRKVRLSAGVILGGATVLGVALWAAHSFAFAPGFGKGEISAAQLLSDSYLTTYVDQSAGAANSRLGFLLFAVDANLHSGSEGLVLGQGPAAAVIGDSAHAGVRPSLSEFFSKAPHLAYSAQRLLLGYGFLGLLVFGFLCVAPVAWRTPGAVLGATALADGVAMALPVMTFVFLVTGPYSAPWTEPGVAGAYWALVAAAVLGRRAPREVEA